MKKHLKLDSMAQYWAERKLRPYQLPVNKRQELI
jgi:hypothetical protein